MTSCPVMLPVSLVVPVRNESQTLLELLDAITRLDAKPLEVVFVDTGSSDCSASIVEGWTDEAARMGVNCRLMRLPDGYPGAARNAGVQVATHDWVAFLDAGIVPAANWLSELWLCKQHHDKEALFGVCHFASDEIIGRILCALSYGYNQTLPVLPASLFRRDLFERVGFFEPGLRSGEDVLWKRALLSAGIPVETCWDAQVYYRHFPTSIPQAASKWFVYERSATVAGLGGGLRTAALFSVLLLCGWLIVDLATGMFGLAAYAFIRGVADPLRRSGWRPWWGAKPWIVLAAVLVAAVIDVSAAVGRVAGMFGGGRVGRS